jgi:hypothetical protein
MNVIHVSPGCNLSGSSPSKPPAPPATLRLISDPVFLPQTPALEEPLDLNGGTWNLNEMGSTTVTFTLALQGQLSNGDFETVISTTRTYPSTSNLNWSPEIPFYGSRKWEGNRFRLRVTAATSSQTIIATSSLSQPATLDWVDSLRPLVPFGDVLIWSKFSPVGGFYEPTDQVPYPGYGTDSLIERLSSYEGVSPQYRYSDPWVGLNLPDVRGYPTVPNVSFDWEYQDVSGFQSNTAGSWLPLSLASPQPYSLDDPFSDEPVSGTSSNPRLVLTANQIPSNLLYNTAFRVKITMNDGSQTLILRSSVRFGFRQTTMFRRDYSRAFAPQIWSAPIWETTFAYTGLAVAWNHQYDNAQDAPFGILSNPPINLNDSYVP